MVEGPRKTVADLLFESLEHGCAPRRTGSHRLADDDGRLRPTGRRQCPVHAREEGALLDLGEANDGSERGKKASRTRGEGYGGAALPFIRHGCGPRHPHGGLRSVLFYFLRSSQFHARNTRHGVMGTQPYCLKAGLPPFCFKDRLRPFDNTQPCLT